MQISNEYVATSNSTWLKSYYFMRAGFSVSWIAAACLVGRDAPAMEAALLVAYPAWDAIANLADARRSGGLRANPAQGFNVLASGVTTVAVAGAIRLDLHAILAVFGAWAILSGILQLVTGVRRWNTGAQWAMVLSGAQSALAGGFFIKQALSAMPTGIMDVVPYAAFGAFYFLVSAVWLTVKRARKTVVERTA